MVGRQSPQPVFLADEDGDYIGGGTGTAASQFQGNVASGTADSGNPVKIAGVRNTTLPALTNGQRGDVQMTANSELIASLYAGGLAISGLATNAMGTGVSSSATALRVASYGLTFNGTTFDFVRKPNASSRIPSAAANNNPTSAKATAGDVHVISGYNAAASVRYLKFYAKATAPTVGTDVPVITLALPPTSAFNINLNGHYIATGIAYALTTGAADADTGALTLADIVGLTITYA